MQVVSWLHVVYCMKMSKMPSFKLRLRMKNSGVKYHQVSSINAGHIFIDFLRHKWTMKHKLLGNDPQINLKQMCDGLIKLYWSIIPNAPQNAGQGESDFQENSN